MVYRMGWLTNPKRMFKTNTIRIYFLFIAGIAYFITETGRFIYRPFIRSNGIQDFGLADSIGNLGGIIVQIFLVCAVVNPNKIQSYRWAAFLSSGYMAFEFVQPYLPKGVFDWNDIIATLIGFLISVLFLWIIWHLFPTTEELEHDY